MNLIETEKTNTCDSFKSKINKIRYTPKPMPSNISLNLISVSVLPSNANWSDMEGFASYKYGPFNFDFKNANADTIAGINFWVTYNCKGQFNSVGHYLSEATISPKVIFANPGYFFTCNVTASNPINYGTKIDPIAGIILKVQMQVKSYSKLESISNHYSLENAVKANVLPISAESAETIDSATVNNSSETINLGNNISFSKSYDTKKAFTSSSSCSCNNTPNSIEKYLSVCVRGDCSTTLICAYGY